MKTLLFLSWLVLDARAEDLAFPKVWEQVEAGSAAGSAARLQQEAASEASARAGRHWLPRLYLDARSYGSNDPGASFQGLLEQRAVRVEDFAPDALNHPSARVFSRAAIGVDLPLYQGGAGSGMAAVAAAGQSSKTEEAEQVRVEQYAETGRAYASLSVLEAGVAQLKGLLADARRLQKGYRLGSKANPVGYSGALGMAAVANKLEGLLQQYEAQATGTRAGLRELGVESPTWRPVPATAVEFVDRYLSAGAGTASHRLDSLRAGAAMSEKLVGVERSKLLPQVGVFGEGYGFRGYRDTATGYSAGLYLRWTLFSPADFGAAGEASLRAAGAERFAEASAQRERADQAGLAASLQALRLNLGLLAETERVMKEQAGVTETLFRNGSINALQFVEVLNRRADLAAQRLEAELGYLRASAEVAKTRKLEIAGKAGK